MEWINVKDSLPSKNGKYLSWNGREVEFQYFQDGYWLMSVSFGVGYENDRIPFTHWMPLPEPLEEFKLTNKFFEKRKDERDREAKPS